tara:strand:+ start:209 stop:2731 length:2523 start_codon:yes stop_codon:yes gene_type:complete
MYQAIHYDHFKKKIHLWDDKAGYQVIPFKKYAYTKSPGGQYVSLYGDRLKKIHDWDPKEKGLFESDVQPVVRFLVDQYTDSDEVSDGHRVMIMDIECEIVDGFPDVQNPKEQITSIAIYDSITDHYTAFVLDPENKFELPSDDVGNRVKEEDGQTIETFKTEFQLLTRFYLKYMEIQPTIITGWNIEFFDIPFLYNRSVQVVGADVANLLSPIREVNWSTFRERYTIAGVNILDYLALYKNFRFTMQSSYRLDHIGEVEVGTNKIEYDGTLNDLYENDLEKFVEYNIHDVRIVKKLDDKLDFIDIARGVAHLGHVPYEDVFMSSRYLEGAILVYLKKVGMVAPDKPPRPKQLSGDKFAGAYVQEPQSGKHSWVYDLDITSMYPSVIRSLNISPETKLGKVIGWDPEEYLQKDLKKTYTIEMKGKEQGKVTNDQLEQYFNDNKVSISSCGVLYRTDKKGLIPSLLTKWFNERVEFRKLAKKFAEEGNDEQHQYFDRRQYLQKIILNSLYGVLGLPVFRFYDLDNAESTTLTGQSLIKFTKKMGNYFYNRELGDDKDYCIYIDTDSVFYSAVPLVEKRFPNEKLSDVMMSKKILDIASEVQTFLNNSYNYFAKRFNRIDEHHYEIKQEVIAKSGLFITKKRYGMKIINDAGVKVNKVHVKGLDTVRSSFAIAMKELLSSVLEDILADVPKEKIDERIVNFRNSMELMDFDRISSPVGVKNISKYISPSDGMFTDFKKGAPVHVKAAINHNDLLKYYKQDKKYEFIKNGSKIKWVYLKENNLGMDVLAYKGYEDPPEIIKFIKENIHHKKIYDQALYKKIMMFYQAMNWDEPTLKKDTIERFF